MGREKTKSTIQLYFSHQTSKKPPKHPKNIYFRLLFNLFHTHFIYFISELFLLKKVVCCVCLCWANFLSLTVRTLHVNTRHQAVLHLKLCKGAGQKSLEKNRVSINEAALLSLTKPKQTNQTEILHRFFPLPFCLAERETEHGKPDTDTLCWQSADRSLPQGFCAGTAGAAAQGDGEGRRRASRCLRMVQSQGRGPARGLGEGFTVLGTRDGPPVSGKGFALSRGPRPETPVRTRPEGRKREGAPRSGSRTAGTAWYPEQPALRGKASGHRQTHHLRRRASTVTALGAPTLPSCCAAPA